MRLKNYFNVTLKLLNNKLISQFVVFVYEYLSSFNCSLLCSSAESLLLAQVGDHIFGRFAVLFSDLVLDELGHGAAYFYTHYSTNADARAILQRLKFLISDN